MLKLISEISSMESVVMKCEVVGQFDRKCTKPEHGPATLEQNCFEFNKLSRMFRNDSHIVPSCDTSSSQERTGGL